MRRVAVVGLLVAACSGGTAVSTTSAAVEQASTTSTVMESTTTTKGLEATTTVPSPLVVVDEFRDSTAFGAGFESRRRLAAGTTYALPFDGVTVNVSPPVEGWEILAFGQSEAALWWRGPSNQKPGTLEVLIFNIDQDTADSAWDRIEGLRDRFLYELDWEWEWIDHGMVLIGEREVEWREVRFPSIAGVEPIPRYKRLVSLRPIADGGATLNADSSARFLVVPVAGLTATVMLWESRCLCEVAYRDTEDRGVENELSMWIPELESFSAGMEFVES